MKKSSNKPVSPAKYIQTRARNLPIHECWVNADWDETNMATVVVARIHSNGQITFALYLVDLSCMGVKDSYFVFNIPMFQYEGFKKENEDYNSLDVIDYNLAHNIIFAGVDFAAEIGLNPCKEFFTTTKFMLAEDNDEIPLIDIECGMDGKPVIFRGAQNKHEADALFAQLSHTIGVENFIFRDIPQPSEEKDWYDEEDEEEEEEKEEDFNAPLWNTETKELEDFMYTNPLKERHADIELIKQLEERTPALDPKEASNFADALDRLFYNHYGYDAVDEAREQIYNFFDLPVEDFSLTDSVLGFEQKLAPEKLKVVEQVNNTPQQHIDYLADVLTKNPDIPYLKYLHCLELEKTLKANEAQHPKNKKGNGNKDAKFADMRQKTLKALIKKYRMLHPDYILLKIMEEENGLHKNEPSIFIENMLANYEPVSDLFVDCESIHSIEAIALFRMLYLHFLNTEDVLGIDSLVHFIQTEHPQLGRSLETIYMLNIAMRTYICKEQYFDEK